jgi:excisionase family DNA binding protein
MPETRRINRVHRSLSRPLTILGAERKLFFFAMCLGAATFNLLNSLFGGFPPNRRPSTQRRSEGRAMTRSAFVDTDQQVSKSTDEYPVTVREAAKYLGVSTQTVYLWVERKQIPHLRVMGRNIRFLKSDLDSFRASFRQEMENA